MTCIFFGYHENELWDFQSRWWLRQTWFASSHNDIKITIKIKNNYHSEFSEIKLNGSLTIMELKKLQPSRLVGGAQRQNRLGRDILGGGSPNPTPGPPVQGSSARKISPHNFCLQKPVGVESVGKKKTAGTPRSSS